MVLRDETNFFMATIAVTGATGFVGRVVVQTLLVRGYHVRALVRKGSAAKLSPHANLDIVEGDPLNVKDVEELLRSCDALVHLVGIRREETKRTGKTYADVDLGSVRVAADAMKRVGLKRILLLSAASIGNSVYVRTKKEAEQAVRDAGLEWTIFRPSFILGKGQRWPIVMTPFLAFFSLFPGHFGDVARRAQNITREQLANAMIYAIEHSDAINTIWDVPVIKGL